MNKIKGTFTLDGKPFDDFETVRQHVTEIVPGVTPVHSGVLAYALHLAAKQINNPGSGMQLIHASINREKAYAQIDEIHKLMGLQLIVKPAVDSAAISGDRSVDQEPEFTPSEDGPKGSIQ